MDALSAIKMMTASPAGNPLAAAGQSGGTPAIPTADLQSLGAGGLGQSIPLPDLQKLNYDLTPQTVGGATSSAAPTTATGGNFENLLGNFVNEVSSQQAAANDSVSGLLSGKNVSLHQAMISMEEANVSFQMMVEVRNRLLDSYQELMRMQV